MNRILVTAAAGALAMYFLDPQGGRRRRVRTRDKAERVARRMREAYDVTLRDTRHRAMGIKAVGRRILRRGGVDDETLAGRVRAALLAVGAVGLALLLRGGILWRLGGAALIARAITNLDFATLVGTGAPEHGIEVQKTICVNAPVEQVFGFWADYENFPHFMSKVRDVHVAGNRSHWVVRGPAGMDVEWTSELVNLEPNSVIAWRSTPDSEVKHAGE